MADNSVDVIVVGGGIQGCAVAAATQAQGYATLLLEQADWGWATSSRSSKLIHGGLRYLQTAQLRLVHECITEREWMLRELPQLVTRNWFYIPVYKNSHFRPWQIHCGLILYFLLGGCRQGGRFRCVPASQWHTLCGLDTSGLQAVFAYQDAQTNDRALTQYIQQTAAQAGAQCLAPAQFIKAEKTATGYAVTFSYDKTTQTVHTRMLVNACGPWVNVTLGNITPAPVQRAIDLVQGTHVVIAKQISTECFYLEAPSDCRAVFVLPWQGKTLIGTTEVLFTGAAEDTRPTKQEIEYLLTTVRHYFPQHPLDIVDTSSGLRVLPRSEQSAFKRPRDVMIDVAPGLISIYGGKLTAWRATAQKVLQAIQQQVDNE